MSFLSILFGAQKGVVKRWVDQRSIQRKNLEENLLKALYQLGEQGPRQTPFSKTQIQQRRHLPLKVIEKGLHRLGRKGLVSRQGEGFSLTQEGFTKGERMVRIHRLWELYLTTHLDLPSDHVHDNAEAIEHIITPETRSFTRKALAVPVRDPHQSPIPYSTPSDTNT